MVRLSQQYDSNKLIAMFRMYPYLPKFLWVQTREVWVVGWSLEATCHTFPVLFATRPGRVNLARSSMIMAQLANDRNAYDAQFGRNDAVSLEELVRQERHEQVSW